LTPEKIDTLILGAGLAGLSTAWFLRGRAIAAEAAETPGGTARTLSLDGFHMDCGVHVLYFRDPWTCSWIANELGIALQGQVRRSAAWLHGRNVPFPVQYNLRALPLRDRCRLGASALGVGLMPRVRGPYRSAADWAEASFGPALTREFLRPYNEKLWGLPFDELGTDWMQDYVPRASARAVLRGLFPGPRGRYGRNSTFSYPKKGGIGAVALALAQQSQAVRYGWNLEVLDLDRHTARFRNGSAVSYRHLVNSIPLPELIAAIQNDPAGLKEAARALRATRMAFAHVRLPRPGVGADLHWLYVPEPEAPFYRITFGHNIGPGTCPAGWSALTLEFSNPPSDRAALYQQSKGVLLRMGLLQESEAVGEVIWDELKYGYVTYDRVRAAAVSGLLAALRRYDVESIGRYGRWEYANMEDAILQGRSAAQDILRR
jgi:protoporphyrinogen oxidase